MNTASITNLCAGTYTVVSTDVFGCTASSSITLTAAAPIVITANVVSPGCVGCADGSIDVTINGGSPGYTYSWSDSSTTEDLANVAGGVYTLCVSDVAGCVACDSFTVLDPVGVNELQLQQNVVIYPNPVSDKSILKIEGDKKEFIIGIYSADGRLVLMDKTIDNSFIMHSASFSKGFYFINVTEEKSGRSKRLPVVID